MTKPWPSSNQLDPRLFPEVANIPWRERLRWTRKVGLRYIRDILFYTPEAIVYGLRNPNVEILDDTQFEQRFNDTVFNKMVVPCESAEALAFARERFPAHFSGPASAESPLRYFLADFSIFADLPTFPGTYAAGSTLLFERRALGERLGVVAIRIGELELIPSDGDAWTLAKLYVIQAASIRLVFGTHALLHFPEDSINAVTKSVLPEDHLLHQLLLPHLDLQLTLDRVVQSSPTSPLVNYQIFTWTPHTGPLAGLVRSAVDIYVGVAGNPAYPAYTYKYPRRSEEENYQQFLEAYYQTILAFVQKVLAKLEPGDPQVMRWADEVAKHVPGFPSGDAIFVTPNKTGFVRNLDWAVATMIWDVSVGHTTDHFDMGQLHINSNPMRLRVPPPTSSDIRLDPSKLARWTDFVRYRLFWRMFLRSVTVLPLADVRYPFRDPELRQLNDEFLRELADTAARQQHEFVPLRDIARSVQF